MKCPCGGTRVKPEHSDSPDMRSFQARDHEQSKEKRARPLILII